MSDEAEDDTGEAATVVMEERTPAYSLLEGGPVQPQCSGNANEFCFFCAFESSAAADGSGDSDGSDHPTSMRSLVRALIDQKREVHTIIQKVKEAYDKNVRPEVLWRTPDGKEIRHPAWSLESIKRHLVASPEFPAIFEDAVELIFANIITSQNRRMMTARGEPDADMVNLFNTTVKTLCHYKESRARLTKQARRGGATKKT